MSSNYKVSVIMSVYNSQNTVSDAIESILNQTHKQTELLIIDDFSEDNTVKIIKKYLTKYKNIKLFLNQKNIGLTKSLNLLLKEADGKFIARQDADDISFPNRIENQINEMINKDLDFCTTRAYRKNKKNKIPGLSYYLPKKTLINFKNPFIHGTLMIKRSVINEIGKYDEDFYYSQDYKLMKDLLNHNFRYTILNKVHYELNMDNNISTNKKSEQQYYAECVKKNVKPEKLI